MRQPPKWIDRLLEVIYDNVQLEIIRGDLHELYNERLESHSPVKAGLLYGIEAIDIICRSRFERKKNKRLNSIDMWRNYLKVSFRNMLRNKTHATINVVGLSVGLACVVLITLYVKDELTYDQMHSKVDRIYRMTELFESEGIGEHSASLPFPVGPTLRNDFPGMIQSTVRLFNFQSPTLALANRKLDKEFNEKRLFFADSSFFEVFDFKLIAGDAETALDEPNSILITQTMAKKYFDHEDPMGQTLEFLGDHNYQVTGILEDSPLNAHFQFDGLISFSSLRSFYNGNYPQNWYWNPCWTYVLLHENSNPKDLEALFPDFIDKYFPDFIKDDLTLYLQALSDIHLTSNLDYEIQANGNSNNVYIFSGVALLVLLISVINYINLSTARSTSRAKEVGIRKTIGSKRMELVKQFLIESVLYVTFSMIVALIMLWSVLPYFNFLTAKDISLLDNLNLPSFTFLFLLIVIIGVLGGIYPALVLSSQRLVSIFRKSNGVNQRFSLRKVLVVFQFSLSIVMIVATIISMEQLSLLQNDDPGFDKENVIMIPVIRTPIARHYKSLKSEALHHPGVISMTAVEEIVGAKHQVANYAFDQMKESKPFPHFQVRHDFIKTFNIPLLAGRDYDENIHTDDTSALIVNEALVDAMQWKSAEEAIGKKFRMGRFDGRIVGVIEDYNFVSKHKEIGPMVLALNLFPGAFQLFIKYVAVKIDGKERHEAIAHLEETWHQFLPNRPFDYFYLDQQLAQSYASEERLSQVTIIFSGLAILVACLGLFGLTTYNLEQRKREIGIRKVLGIEGREVFWLLSKEFILLILVAFLIATPLAYFGINRWLDGFAYRVSLAPWSFFIAFCATSMIAFLTLLYHTIRATLIQPADVLKVE